MDYFAVIDVHLTTIGFDKHRATEVVWENRRRKGRTSSIFRAGLVDEVVQSEAIVGDGCRSRRLSGGGSRR